MLTSSHYLLGGILAGSCAVGALLHGPVSLSSSLSSEYIEASPSDTVDISYRGSGRVDDEPTPTKATEYSAQTNFYPDSAAHYSSLSREKDLVSHRGSGRVRPVRL